LATRILRITTVTKPHGAIDAVKVKEGRVSYYLLIYVLVR